MTVEIGILQSTYDALRSLFEELTTLLHAHGVTAKRLLIEDLGCSKPAATQFPPVVLVLSNSPEALQMASWLSYLGVRVINHRFFDQGSDRITVHLRLQAAGVPTLPAAFGAHPGLFTDSSLWNMYPAILKSTVKEAVWPVVNSIGELHDWVEATRPHRFGWLAEHFVPADITTKWYVVGNKSHAVDKRARDDMQARVNPETDVARLGRRIARALALEVGSVDMVRDKQGSLWPVDVNSIPAFRVWPKGYALLAKYLAAKVKQGGGRRA